MTTYLETLTERLARGAAKLPTEVRQAHTHYLLSTQAEDGGFGDRDGDSDLYYTGFALRGLVLLDALDDQTAGKAARYLQQQFGTRTTIIDFISLLYGALLLQVSNDIDLFAHADPNWPHAVAETLERLRRPDGGYAKSDEGASSSTYHTFLVILCYQLIGKPLIEPQRMIEFLRGRQREDGGFVEIQAMRRSGTNPTSAAIASLRILEGLTDEIVEDACNYLADRQSDEGGLQANTRIPVADVLSTFTGMLTLDDLGALDWLDLPAVRRYLDQMQLPEGGFKGATLDPACDVEYTFYGLGSLALLENAK